MIKQIDEIEITRIAQKKVDRYSHDAFFHYLVKGHEGIRRTLCQKMIKDHTIVETTVIDGKKSAHFYDGKHLVLDILARDELGNLYNVEMQCYVIDREEMVRFQLYNFRVIDDEAKKGVDYDKVRPLRQMIINVTDPVKGLDQYIHHFELYDSKNKVSMPYSLYEIYIVQLAYLDMENIDIEEFDELMYLFKNDEAYDKIKVHRNVLEAMKMHSEFNMSEERYEALRRERDEMTRRFREQAAIERAEKLGIEIGMQKGIAEGMTQGIEKGIEQAKIETLTSLYEKKFGSLSDDTKDKLQKIDIEKADELLLLIFEIENEEQLKVKL